MNWKQLGKSIGGLFPALGGALAGPGGALAGSVAARVLGVEASPTAIEAALTADPEAYRKLREMEADLEKARMLDTQHARETFKNGNKLQLSIAVGIMILVASMVVGLFFLTIPTGNNEVLYLAAGSLLTAFGTLVNYFFGSSNGSAAKQQTIDTIAMQDSGGVIGALREWRASRGS